jgi:hypothetical protein
MVAYEQSSKLSRFCAFAVVLSMLMTLVIGHHSHDFAASELLGSAERQIFVEASHPGEAPHFEPVSAPEVRRCDACLHKLQAGSGRLTPLAILALLVSADSAFSTRVFPAPQHRRSAVSSRAPPALLA